MRILGGTKTSHEHLYNWMGSYTRHLDVDVRHELSIAYTTFGHLTSIGNVWIFAHAIHESDFFKKETFMRANNPAIHVNKGSIFSNGSASSALGNTWNSRQSRKINNSYGIASPPT